jgi:hypothetical protein
MLGCRVVTCTRRLTQNDFSGLTSEVPGSDFTKEGTSIREVAPLPDKARLSARRAERGNDHAARHI